MGYTDPNSVTNPTAGNSLPASFLDTCRDDLEWLARNLPHCRVYNSGAIAVANTTLTAMTFNSERIDVGACHSTVSNTGRLTVPAGGAGYYGIFGNIAFAANATGQRAVRIKLNGTTEIGAVEVPNAGAGELTAIAVYTEYQLIATDYLELYAYQTSGGSLNVNAQGNYSPEFGMRWVCL